MSLEGKKSKNKNFFSEKVRTMGGNEKHLGAELMPCFKKNHGKRPTFLNQAPPPRGGGGKSGEEFFRKPTGRRAKGKEGGGEKKG